MRDVIYLLCALCAGWRFYCISSTHAEVLSWLSSQGLAYSGAIHALSPCPATSRLSVWSIGQPIYIYIFFLFYSFFVPQRFACCWLWFCILLFNFALAAGQVYRQSFWMKIYGSLTAKRTKVWSNSPAVRGLRTGKLKTRNGPSRAPKLVNKTISKNGKRGYTGSKKALKASQTLICA